MLSGGNVAKKPHGLMALFGYPWAQENDAERAARAAPSIQRALADLNRKNTGARNPELVARIGLETGPAVVDVRDHALAGRPPERQAAPSVRHPFEFAGSFDWLMAPARRGAFAPVRSRETLASLKSLRVR